MSHSNTPSSTQNNDTQVPPFRIQAPELEAKQRTAAKLLSLIPLHLLPPKLFRYLFTVTDRLLGLNKTEMARVIDSEIPLNPKVNINNSIKIRAYYPTIDNAKRNNSSLSESTVKPKKTLVYFHGGGCVIGSINSHDRFCRYLAKHGNMNIISIDYRLAPEHKFPIPICDAIDSWNYINDNHEQLNIQLGSIGVGGDSAGAYLACIIGLKNIQNVLPVNANVKPAFQFLLYPMLDLQGLTNSYRKFDKQLILTRTLLDYFRDHYINSLDETTLPLVSPLQIKDVGQSPNTYILTLGFDPLRDDGIAYAKRLQNAGISTHHEHYDDCMHGFISVTRISTRAKEGVHHIAMALNKFNA